jgi:hypothetical protein
MSSTSATAHAHCVLTLRTTHTILYFNPRTAAAMAAADVSLVRQLLVDLALTGSAQWRARRMAGVNFPPASQVTPVLRAIGSTASPGTRREFPYARPHHPAPESSPGIMVGLASKQGGEKGVSVGATPTARLNRIHPSSRSRLEIPEWTPGLASSPHDMHRTTRVTVYSNAVGERAPRWGNLTVLRVMFVTSNDVSCL